MSLYSKENVEQAKKVLEEIILTVSGDQQIALQILKHHIKVLEEEQWNE